MVGVKEANEYDYWGSDSFLDKIEPFIDPVNKEPIVERGKQIAPEKYGKRKTTDDMDAKMTGVCYDGSP